MNKKIFIGEFGEGKFNIYMSEQYSDMLSEVITIIEDKYAFDVKGIFLEIEDFQNIKNFEIIFIISKILNKVINTQLTIEIFNKIKDKVETEINDYKTNDQGIIMNVSTYLLNKIHDVGGWSVNINNEECFCFQHPQAGDGEKVFPLN